jgi:hypothetical protein
MFSGIQGCTYFVKKQQDEQSLVKIKVPMDKEENEEVSLKEVKEVLSLFPEFAKMWQGKQDLAKASALMFKGDYEASLKHNRRVLRQFPRTLGDQALFQMGLNYSHTENPNPDNQKSIECFQRIIEEFPESSIRDEAVIWILFIQKSIENKKRFDNLQHQKENLKDQIEKLKKIDLGIEDKKRIDLSK